MSKIPTALTGFLYLVAMGTIILSASFPNYENTLSLMTEENGFFESVSVLLLLSISVYGIMNIKNKSKFSTLFFYVIIIFSTLTFLAAMEEVSWGQHIFHFKSGDFFLEKNLQAETNLHNLIDGNIFSSIVYSCVYTFLVFIPLSLKLFPDLENKINALKYFNINPHIILIVLFASSFQIYFYDDFSVWSDMLTHIVALLLFAVFLIVNKSSKWLKLHFLFLLAATTISMLSYEIYRFENMQYEIREMFVVLASLFVFIEIIQKEKRLSL